MAGRNFRQRPVDVHRQLDIVRDETLLDSNDGLPIKLESQAKPAQHGKVWNCFVLFTRTTNKSLYNGI